MKRIFYLLFFAFIIAASVRAQVTIGSLNVPQRGAVLELKSDTLGFLPPRVALSKLSLPDPLPVHVEGMVVYNTTDNPADTLQAGLYYNTGTRWMSLSISPYNIERWFYMPSIVFDTSNTGKGLTKDLYGECKNQLNNNGALVKSSTGAPAQVLATMPAPSDLYYYVTGYDDTVFANISIDAKGLMTYDIIGAATDSTYINIVFVEKQF